MSLQWKTKKDDDLDMDILMLASLIESIDNDADMGIMEKI